MLDMCFASPRGLLSALFLSLLLVVAQPSAAQPDPVLSTVTPRGSGSVGTLVNPDGNAPGLSSPGSELLVRVRDAAGVPIVGLSPREFEVDGSPLATMSDAFFAQGAHNVVSMTVVAPGDYLLDGSLYSGGCGRGMVVRVQGVLVNSGQPVANPFTSLDISGPGGNPDGIVNLVDLGDWALRLQQMPGYDPCLDLNFDGLVNLSDVSVLSLLLAPAYGTTFPPGAVLDVD